MFSYTNSMQKLHKNNHGNFNMNRVKIEHELALNNSKAKLHSSELWASTHSNFSVQPKDATQTSPTLAKLRLEFEGSETYPNPTGLEGLPEEKAILAVVVIVGTKGLAVGQAKGVRTRRRQPDDLHRVSVTAGHQQRPSGRRWQQGSSARDMLMHQYIVYFSNTMFSPPNFLSVVISKVRRVLRSRF